MGVWCGAEILGKWLREKGEDFLKIVVTGGSEGNGIPQTVCRRVAVTSARCRLHDHLVLPKPVLWTFMSERPYCSAARPSRGTRVAAEDEAL
jgi:hypothetical protein